MARLADMLSEDNGNELPKDGANKAIDAPAETETVSERIDRPAKQVDPGGHFQAPAAAVDEPMAGMLLTDPQRLGAHGESDLVKEISDPELAESELAESERAGPGRLHKPGLAVVSDAYERLVNSGSLATWAGLAVAVISSLYVLIQMRPGLLLMDTTPSGGDMGAHVWGPAFMRDHLLTEGRLTGWTPDWYAGFPAYQYYMVIPALAIIAVNAGLPPLLGVPLAVVALAFSFSLSRSFPAFRAAALSAGVLAAVMLVAVPYGVAFKLVSVAGLVAFPLAAYVMGRLTRCPEPVPAFLSLGSVVFLFDTNFTIYGGNIASTLAGEFAFSLSLCLSLLAIGLAARGMDTGRWRASAGAVIALVALSHVIPLFFIVSALVVLVLFDEKLPRSWALAAGITVGLVPLTFAESTGLLVKLAALVSFLVVMAAVMSAEPRVFARAKWLMAAGPVAALISAFWLLPFYARSEFFNDMGWERLTEVRDALLTDPMKVALPVAAVGAVLAFAIRDRMGMLFTVLALGFASGVANLPHGKLWNARLLPFYYLSVYFLAAVAIGLVARFAAAAVSERLDNPSRPIMAASALIGVAATLVAVSLPLRILPLGQDTNDGGYSWFGARSNAVSFVPSWVAWNYSGYEEKRSFREYRDVVSTMDNIGEDVGCGRAMWEYNSDLDRYGTPMALMLLPHWTDGCIGSMEGLYFESSATTPFHFLNQSMLSTAPSRAQRDLPYQDFDIDRGIAQLQVMGVRYYMAQTDEAIAAADDHPDLVRLEVSEPFVIFEVAGTQLVQGLDAEPVVAAGRSVEEAGELASRFESGWLSQAVQYYNSPNAFSAIPAADGPPNWERVSTQLETDGQAISAADISNIEVGTNSLSFSVSEVDKPVLVKISYFPNWKVSGAEGPWRAGPNLMVVVPTETEVQLSYGTTKIEYFSYLLTLLGLGGLVGFTVLDARRRRSSVLEFEAASIEVSDVEAASIEAAGLEAADVEAADVEVSGLEDGAFENGEAEPTEAESGV